MLGLICKLAGLQPDFGRAFAGYLVTTLATATFGLATAPWQILIASQSRSVAGTRSLHASYQPGFVFAVLFGELCAPL
jgi:hypothetical protein